MTRKVLIAAVQLPCFRDPMRPGETNADRRESNLRTAERMLDQAGEAGADIACVGESFTSEGLQMTRANFRTEIEQGSQAIVERIGAIARRHRMYIIAPIWGLVDGLPRNISLVLDRKGEYTGGYCKVHCTEGERDLGIVPGDEWPTFALDFGRIGIQTCHDASFPESARCLAVNGAEIIFWPHVMSGWGDQFMDVLLRAPAIYNGVHHVPVCYGRPLEQAWMPGMMIGHSSIIRPDGTFVADAGRQVGIALGSVDLDAPRIASGFTRAGDYVFRIDMFNERRPETYTPLVRPWPKTPSVPAPSHPVEEAA